MGGLVGKWEYKLCYAQNLQVLYSQREINYGLAIDLDITMDGLPCPIHRRNHRAPGCLQRQSKLPGVYP